MPSRIIRAIRRHATYANVAATISLASIAAATAHAAGVGSGGIADNSIQSRDIRNGTITSIDLANGGVQLADLSSVARSGLDGKDGTDGAPGERGLQGIPGERGPAGPQGSAGTSGTVIDDILDLEGLGCSRDQRAGTIDVSILAPEGDVAPVTVECALGPSPCGTQPSHTLATCNPNVQPVQWFVTGCTTNYYDLNGDMNNPAGNGCEYFNVPSNPPTEDCDGYDDDSDGQFDEGLTSPPYANGFATCGGVDGWQYFCNPGFADANAIRTDGCEVQL